MNRECSQGVRVTGGPKESWKKSTFGVGKCQFLSARKSMNFLVHGFGVAKWPFLRACKSMNYFDQTFQV
jgi:hypothetical protein